MKTLRLIICATCAITAMSSSPVVSLAAPATTPAAGSSAPATTRFAVVDGNIVQPATRCQWSDLFSITARGGKLDVESHPPTEIAGMLTNRRQIDVEITDAADKYWRLQGIAAQPAGAMLQAGGAAFIVAGGVRFRIGGPAAGAAAPAPVRPAGNPAHVDFSATPTGRPQPTDGPRVSRLMVMYGGFQLRGRWLHDGRTYQIDFKSFQDKTNVSLNVREYVRGRGAAILTMEAADLQQIRRERPAELRMYLEPMLIEICGGRNPLRPQAGDVYRAFTSIPADSDAAERVKRIVETFDSLEPAVRESASAELNQLGRAAVLAAVRTDRTELSPEQCLRLDDFIARNSGLGDVAAARRDPVFLIDCLEDEDRAVRAAALESLGEVMDHDIDFDIDAPAEQRAADVATLQSLLLATPATSQPKTSP